MCWLTNKASQCYVRYQPLAADERDSDSSGEEKDIDLRYVYMPKSCKKIPWKSIALALFLLALGSALLFLSFFVFSGHMAGDKSQAYAFLLLGILAFLPGMQTDFLKLNGHALDLFASKNFYACCFSLPDS